MRNPAAALVSLTAIIVALTAILALPGSVRGAGRLAIPLGLDAYLPVPEDNPLTPRKIELGRRLFNDKQLSRDRKIACSTCHDPKKHFTDEKPLAEGVFGRKGNRRVPAILNRAYGRAFFWDGRIPTLEEQVLQPILNEKEMDMKVEEVIERLRPDHAYREAFEAVFTRPISEEDLARALASYVRTLLTGDSRYDRYINGDSGALSKLERRGLDVFRGKGNCIDCHVGPNLSDERFRNTGIAWKDGKLDDIGRFEFSKIEKDRGAFKTPTLRNVAERPPYMHNGSLASLEDVVDYYSRGANRNPYLNREIHVLNLSDQEKRALVAFLHTLTGEVHEGM